MPATKLQSITIIGRRWFNGTYGNTYHTVTVLVDGELVFSSDITYGYGDHYIQTATEWLDEHGYVSLERYSNGGMEPLWRYCKDRDIEFYCNVTDVARKRDLDL